MPRCHNGAAEPESSVWTQPFPFPWLGRVPCWSGTQKCVRGPGREIWFASAFNVKAFLMLCVSYPRNFPTSLSVETIWFPVVRKGPSVQELCVLLYSVSSEAFKPPRNYCSTYSVAQNLFLYTLRVFRVWSPLLNGVCTGNIMEFNMGATLSWSHDVLDLHNVRIDSMKLLCAAIQVFHPGVMKDSRKTVFLLQAYNF